MLRTSYVDDCLDWPGDAVRPPFTGPLPDVPALLLGGRLDTRTPVENAFATKRELPHASVVTLKGSGHDAQDSDVTGCINEALRAVHRACAGRASMRGQEQRRRAGAAAAALDQRLPVGARRRRQAGARAVRGARHGQRRAPDLAAGRCSRACRSAAAGCAADASRGEAAFDGRLTLNDYQYVPGLRVSGTLSSSDGALAGTLRVTGTAHGTLKLDQPRRRDRRARRARSALQAHRAAPPPRRVGRAWRSRGTSRYGGCRSLPAEAVATRSPVAALRARPRAMALAGALVIAFSAILVKQSGASPSTAAIFRCAYAVPVLAVLAWMEDRRLGPRDARGRGLAALAGVFFAADLICWHHAIEDVGAGLATVLGNLQVAFVPLVAWLALAERPAARVLATLPLVLSGVVLISGALEHGAYGDNPAQGVIYGIATGLAYTAFILLLRAGSGDQLRVAGPLFDATLVAAVMSIAAGLVIGDADLVPSWPAHAWLAILALTSQVLGWLLISASLPRLPAALTSLLLTIQPVGAVMLGVVLFAESPSTLQLLGVVAILGGLVMVARVRPPATEGI